MDVDRERATTNERLNVVIGTLDVVQDTLRDHGRKLAEHDARFDRIDDRLELVVDWIQRQP